jgi:hypothetical protein
MALELGEVDARQPSLQVRSEILGSGMSRPFLFRPREEHPKQSSLSEARLAIRTRSQVAYKARVSELHIADRCDLVRFQMRFRHLGILLKKTIPVFRFLHRSPPGLSPATEKFWVVLLEAPPKALLCPEKGYPDIRNRHFHPGRYGLVPKPTIVPEFEQFSIARR